MIKKKKATTSKPATDKRLENLCISVALQSEFIEKMMENLRLLLDSNRSLEERLRSGNVPLHPVNISSGHTAIDLLALPSEVRYFNILNALASCEPVGIYAVPRFWLGVIAEFQSRSGYYATSLSKLQKDGWISRPSKGTIGLTQQTRSRLTAGYGLSTEELIRKIYSVFVRQDAEILEALITVKGDWLERHKLAAATSQSAESSAFRERLTQLRKLGFVEFGPNQTVRITLAWWFSPSRPNREPDEVAATK